MVMCQVGEGLAVREVGAPPPDRGQITGTILHLLGAAAARPQLPSRASAELSPPLPTWSREDQRVPEHGPLREKGM